MVGYQLSLFSLPAGPLAKLHPCQGSGENSPLLLPSPSLPLPAYTVELTAPQAVVHHYYSHCCFWLSQFIPVTLSSARLTASGNQGPVLLLGNRNPPKNKPSKLSWYNSRKLVEHEWISVPPAHAAVQGVAKSQTQLRETTTTPFLREIWQPLYLVAYNCKNLGIKRRETVSICWKSLKLSFSAPKKRSEGNETRSKKSWGRGVSFTNRYALKRQDSIKFE